MALDELTNPGDTLITLRISGNQLVRVCNAIQALLYQSGRMKKGPGDDWEFFSEHYKEVNDTVERMRDELSAQRCAKIQ